MYNSSFDKLSESSALLESSFRERFEMGLSVTRNITLFIIILLFLDVRGMSSLFGSSSGIRLVRRLSGAGSQSTRRLSDRPQWPATDALTAQRVDLVYAVAQTDPCAQYQRNRRSTSRASSQGSNRSSRSSQSATPDDKAAAFQRCIDAGDAYRQLGASWKPECLSAVGAECMKKGGQYGCYLKMGSRRGLGSFGCFGGGGPTERTFPECTGYITRYKTQENIVTRMAEYGH